MHSYFTVFLNVYMYTRLTGHSWTDCFLFTPLHSSAFNGHVETARLLVKEGTDINVKDSIGVRE